MTTYTTSTIQLFTNALLANLALRPVLAKTIIADGVPPMSTLQANEWLMLGDVEGNQKWAGIGNANRPRDEEYTIDGIISVIAQSVPNDTGGQTILNERAFTLLAEIELELRGNPTQGIVPVDGETGGWIMYSEMAGPIKLTKRGNDTSREAALEFGISVKARL